MAVRRYIDNAPTVNLSAGISSGTTSIPVTSLAGYPTQFPYTGTLEAGTVSAEQVLVTASSGLTLTVQRNHNGQGVFSHPIGATFNHTADAIDYIEANAHNNANTNVHGVSGAVVGTTDTQTLTNKTLIGATMVGVGGNPAVVGTTATAGDIGLASKDHTGAVAFKVDGNGLATLASAHVTGAATVDGGAAVTGGLTTDTVHATGAATVDGAVTVGGAATIAGAINANGFVHANAGVGVGGGATVAGGATVTGGLGTDTVHATGAATIDGAATVAGDVKSHGVILPLGTLARQTFTANGTAAGTTEIIDSGIPILTFTALGSRRVEIIVAGRGLTGGVTGSRYAINLRDGGATTPTSASPLFGNHNAAKVFEDAEESFVIIATDLPVAGAHSIGVFLVQLSGSGTATPTGAGEIYAKDIGAV